ncbi:MBL fold metallo-hydrolase [Pectobacterium parvum]|uniref:MBL fold metallo-hydrolase n=2 Tax=Pectobacterium TaxID=122277 RepID=A0ABW8G416_9GAMM|nr:MBL fold metallo-hydrolase [Pectobacterium parvum]UFK37997.1 MBL fold metallo-hydrolase [Pectobacterium parvum]UVD96174.1 MBL fold metallo-hydrolase [Pectobacterium parvum]GKW44109.1 MBL fold metallo-hydrolase [Pectobacterium carotovorum subsp. carotovorum]
MKVFNIWFVIKVGLIIALVSVLAVVAYLQHPLFGQLPTEEQLARITQSRNYLQGEFRNQLETPLLTTDESQFSIMLSNSFGNNGNPRPPGALPAMKTDLKALDVKRDLVVWLGHSSYFVQMAGKRILIDPVFSANAAPIPWANEAFEGTNLYSAQDMPDIDVLLISHDHYDHLDYPTVLALRDKVKRVVVGLGVGAHFKRWGYSADQIQEADWNDIVKESPELDIHVVPARHFSGRTLTRDQSLWVGFALLSPQRRIFFSGDSGYGPHFAAIGQQLGPFDWATVDTGQYDPRWAYVHMNPEEAAQAAEDLRARTFTPGHAGRFSISPHDWDDPFKRITTASAGRGYALWTPEIGRTIYLDDQAQTFTRWWEQVR